MSNAILCSRYAEEKLKGTIQNDEPLGFHWDKEVDVDLGVGKQHAESQQQSEDSSRGTDNIERIEE